MQDALTEARSLSVEFGPTLANHAAMVLLAQRELGGTEAQARHFLDSYLEKNGLGPMAPSPLVITRATWEANLGNRAAEEAHRAFFRAELARTGDARALAREFLPRLLPGIAASALHALMRLAYATHSGDEAEIAESLGYWSATYLELGTGSGAAPGTRDPVAVLLHVAAQPDLAALRFGDGLLWHAMRETAAQPGFAGVHDMLEVGPDTLDRIAAAALSVMAATMEFCALHAVTGTHWVRLILPLLEPTDQARAIRFFWQAIAACYPKMEFPAPLDTAEAERQRALPAPGWDAIAEAARASLDEHDISLAWSARAEEAHRGDPLYRVIAARRVGLMQV